MSIAPADSRPHRRWPRWQQALAYLLLAALAALSIWFVDRDAMHVGFQTPPNNSADQ